MAHQETTTRLRRVLLSTFIFSLLFLPALLQAQPTAGPDYIVGQTSLPAANQAGVAYVGTDIYVGAGTFAVGGQSIIRVAPDGTSTTLVTGLNSIGGVAYNAACDILLFTDNGLEGPGATTGDTVYGLPAPRDAVGSVNAATLELIAPGTIPTAANVLGLPDCSVLVTDPTGDNIGRVVKVDAGVASDLVTGLDFVSGLALTDSDELLVGEVDANTFAGSVHRFDLAGSPLGTLATGLSGSFDAALDPMGDLIVTGGFTFDFGSSTLVRIAPDSTVDEIASGFGFTSGVAVDAPSGQIAALDFGVAGVDTLTPVANLTAGGKAKKDCQVEWWGGETDLNRRGHPIPRWTCHDGDACDRDGAVDGSCTFLVGACFAVDDARLAACQSPTIEAAVLTSKKLPDVAAELQGAVNAVLPTSAPVCSRAVAVTIPVSRKGPSLGIKTIVGGKRGDRDRLGLRCRASD